MRRALVGLLWVILLAPCPSSASAQDDLAAIVKRLDSEDPSSREAAQADLESWCDRTGDGAADALRALLEGASAEVRARLQVQLTNLAGGEETRRVLAVYDCVDKEVLGEPPKDLKAACDQALAKDWSNYGGLVGGERTHNEPDLERVTRLAGWAFDAGMRSTAVALVAKAQAWVKRCLQGSHRREDSLDLPEVVASTLVMDMRETAIEHARAGASRSSLLAEWKRIAAVPSTKWHDEALSIIAGYQNLIAEDSGWKERSESEVVALDIPSQVEYWIHEIRDIAMEPADGHGRPEVIQTFWERGAKPTNAAEHLVALEWAALPCVIQHLDDRRPTRSSRWLKYTASYLFTYAECCERIFETITGVDLNPHGLAEVDRAACKEAAEEWWKKLGSGGPEKAFSAQLDSPRDLEIPIAAEWLMKKDPQRYLARIMTRVAAAEPDYRYNPLKAIIDHLTKEHEGYMRQFLREEEDLCTATLVADRLVKACDSEEGLQVLASRLLTKDPKLQYRDLGATWALEVLANSGRRFGVDAFLRCLREGSANVQHDALFCSAWCPDPRIADAMAAYLDNRQPTRDDYGGGKMRYCDFAASALEAMLGTGDSFPVKEPEAQRDERIAALKAWWAAHHDSIDWEALKKKRLDAQGK